MIKNFVLQSVEDAAIQVASIPGINALQLDYVSSIGGANAPKPGADVTAENIALAIMNQGSLATKDSVSATEIADRAITTVKLALEAVTADIVAAGAITENKLYTGAVTADKIAANSITAAKIAANTITANEIAASTITAAKMNVAQISAISANLGSITAGTITGATIQTNIATYPYVKINSAGIQVSGTSVLNFITDAGSNCGYIGGDSSNGLYLNNTSSQISIYGRYGVNILASASDAVDIQGMDINLEASNGGAITVSGGDIRPLTAGGANCGSPSYLWSNVYAYNISMDGGNYINVSNGFIQSNSQFRVTGSINLTGNLNFENYASISIKDSVGTTRTLTCQYDATIGKYILST